MVNVTYRVHMQLLRMMSPFSLEFCPDFEIVLNKDLNSTTNS